MQIYDANSWELYYCNRPRYSWDYKGREANKSRQYTKKQKERRRAHNDYMILTAKKYVKELRENKSALEDKMIEFLDNQNVIYEFQKIFYIKDKNDYIITFYVADFYLPMKELIIETDGKFHEDRKKEDEIRTKRIKKYYPNIEIIRWKWYDFDSYVKMKELVSKIK